MYARHVDVAVSIFAVPAPAALAPRGQIHFAR
jgi:hypothetical protein